MGFLKKAFRSGDTSGWEDFARSTRAEIVKGSLTRSDRVVTKYKSWYITLDKYTVSSQYSHQVFTRLTAYYRTTDELSFKISRKSAFYKIGRFFGIKDIETGNPDFDNAFLIQGSDSTKLMSLFSDRELRQAVSDQTSTNIQAKKARTFINRKIPEGVFSLVYQELGIITDIDHLKLLHELIKKFLEQLYNIGSATKEMLHLE
ncbi:hypothetical protein ACFL6G_00345 [candidate division KSB1 bacterium]